MHCETERFGKVNEFQYQNLQKINLEDKNQSKIHKIS